MPRMKFPPRPRAPSFHHDELTAPLAVAHQTSIQMPNLRYEAPFYALFILEDVPIDTVNTILEKNAKHLDDYDFWLADRTFEALPDVISDGTTKPPIPADWVSPFVGKTVEEAFEFLATVPLDRKLGRQFIAVLNKRLYEEKDWLVMYRIDEEGEITSIPCKAELTCMQMRGYGNNEWPAFLEDWLRKGYPVLS